MLLILLGLLFAAPLLWTISVGAVHDAREARRLDPRAGCQAWVEVPGLRRRRYRCGAPRDLAGPWCRRHLASTPRAGDVPAEVTLVDEPQAVGRAVVRARFGIPLAIVGLAAAGVGCVWSLQRFVL